LGRCCPDLGFIEFFLGGCHFVDPAGCGIEIRAFCSSSLVRKIEIIIWKPILRIMQSKEREENK